MRWYTSVDGERRATLRVAFRLTREELRELLCANWAAVTGTELTASEVSRLIHDQLADDRSGAHYWHERVDDEEADERSAWADRQVAKL